MNQIELQYHPVTIADKQLFIDRKVPLCGMNCDLNFMNIFSWQPRYNTEIAEWRTHLIFRFIANGHVAFMSLFDKEDLAGLLPILIQEAERNSHPFLMMGVCEKMLPLVEAAMPDFFVFEYNRNYCDYIYRHDDLANLAGKKLQSKRNFVNRFRNRYPDYIYKPLSPEDFTACLQLDKEWMQKEQNEGREDDVRAERQSIQRVFDNWDTLGGTGGVIYVGDQLVAYTYGAPISEDIFDVCVEKASPDFEGAYAIINKEFCSHLPDQYELINREEDLGIDGLRKAKLSYQPEIILKKYSVITKHHFSDGKIL
ncbi:MAG: phosphatidylglycerol lysyltransferase domain-containing protein [Bacteroidaceae bacterium]|jgi:hypothetical protein|nr:phosphatidylglycerol lysyltransferase domain-containing protein [Bacteroidaceae bacterium]